MCGPGTYPTNMASYLNYYSEYIECISCPVGTYSAAAGEETCTTCPEWTTTLKAGASTISDCGEWRGSYREW